ncbi:hypothetical protein GEMRC1_004131 [Eukaryota sp. GEM-RC1]
MGKRARKSTRQFEVFDPVKIPDDIPEGPIEEEDKPSRTVKRIQHLKQLAQEPKVSRKRTSSSVQAASNLPKQQAGENFYQYQHRLREATKENLIKTAQNLSRKKIKQKENKKKQVEKRRERVVQSQSQLDDDDDSMSHDVVLFGEVVDAPPDIAPPLKKMNKKQNNYSGTLASILLNGGELSLDQERDRVIEAYRELKKRKPK